MPSCFPILVAFSVWNALCIPVTEAKISTVGFHNRFYRGQGYSGTRVLEHNQSGRFQQYVEATWTQSAAVDEGGRVWIADRARHQVVVVDAGTRYVPWPAFYWEYAGIVHEPGHSDGFRLQARLNGPMGLAVSSAVGQPLLIYVADTNNHCIRRLDYSQGRTSTVVGGPEHRGLRDGPGREAWFDFPMSLGIDSTGRQLFVLDNYRLIRHVDLSGTVPMVTTLVPGACRALSRQTLVASIVMRQVACHPDWHAADEGGVQNLQHFSNLVMCVGHQATCNPRHHPAISDSQASNRYELQAAGAA